jgi:hypothetical protein
MTNLCIKHAYLAVGDVGGIDQVYPAMFSRLTSNEKNLHNVLVQLRNAFNVILYKIKS